MGKLTVLVFLSVFFTNHVYSQDFKLAGIQYTHYPNSEIKGVSDNQETSFYEFGAFLNFPKKLKNDKTVLINGGGYGFVEITSHNFPSLPTSEEQTKLQAFYYQLSLLHQWNKKWSLLVNLKPTIASDFEEKLSLDDLVFQGLVIATKNINDKFKIGLGIAHTTRWGSPSVLPVLNMRYKNSKHQVNAILPLNLNYTYSLLPEEKLNLGVKYSLNGGNFNILASGQGAVDKINYSRANFGVLANYNFTKMLRLELEGGISTGRKYRLVEFDNNVNNFDSKAAPFFNVGIVLVPPKLN